MRIFFNLMHHTFSKTPNLERSGARSLSFDIDPDENIQLSYRFFFISILLPGPAPVND